MEGKGNTSLSELPQIFKEKGVIVISLQVWMPLNGDLTNNGVGNPTISCNATVDNSGKIGKCYVCASGNHISFTNPITTSTTDFAISCWIYVTEYTSGYSNVFSSRTATSGKGLALWVTSSSIRFDDGEMWTVSNTFTLNTWTHICVTYSKTNGKSIYVNGNLIGSKATVGTLANLRSELFIGYDHYGYYLGGKINDLRVWEGSTPSPKEVEILSRGLVLHYPLTGGSRGGDNLLKYTAVNSANQTLLKNTYSGTWSSVMQLTTIDGYDCYKYPTSSSSTAMSSGAWYTGMAANTTYTYSAWIYFTAASSTPFNFTSLGHFQVYNNQSTASDKSHEDVVSARIYEPSTIPSNKWTKIRITFTTNNLANSYFVIYPRYNINANVGDLYIRGFKLELGSTPTPWLPNSADAEYTSMGYDSITEYDVSGYCYNGTRNGAFSWSSDTPRYSVSTLFTNANSNYISLGSKIFDMTSATFSVWFKVKTAQTWSRIFDFGSSEGAGYCIGLATGSNGTTLTVWGRCGSAGSALPDKQIQTISLNTWYHAVITINSTICNCYVNGQLVISFSMNSAFPNATTFNYIYFGKSVFNADKYFDGYISDFRMYATCLTANQVKELYNTSVSITNNGTLMTQGSFVES